MEVTDLGHVKVVIHVRLCTIQRLMQLGEGGVGVPGCLLCATANFEAQQGPAGVDAALVQASAPGRVPGCQACPASAFRTLSSLGRYLAQHSDVREPLRVRGVGFEHGVEVQFTDAHSPTP